MNEQYEPGSRSDYHSSTVSKVLLQTATLGCALTCKFYKESAAGVRWGQRLREMYLVSVEVQNLETFQRSSTRERDVCLTYTKLGQCGGHYDLYNIAPFSKTFPKSTLTRSRVCPWDLWILIAHAKISGSYKKENIPTKSALKAPVSRLGTPTCVRET